MINCLKAVLLGSDHLSLDGAIQAALDEKRAECEPRRGDSRGVDSPPCVSNSLIESCTSRSLGHI